MVGCPKLTWEMVDEAIRLKADGLVNGDIICVQGIHELAFYRWIGDPKNKLHRTLSEGQKKWSAFKQTLLVIIHSQRSHVTNAGQWRWQSL